MRAAYVIPCTERQFVLSSDTELAKGHPQVEIRERLFNGQVDGGPFKIRGSKERIYKEWTNLPEGESLFRGRWRSIYSGCSVH